MSEGSHVSDVGDTQWQDLVAESLPGIVWSTDTDLRMVTCHGAELSAISATAGDVCGRTLFDIFRTTDPDFAPIAAHQQAIAGISGPLALTLANTNFHGYVAPLRWQGAIAGCVAWMCSDPQLDMRRESILNTVAGLDSVPGHRRHDPGGEPVGDASAAGPRGAPTGL